MTEPIVPVTAEFVVGGGANPKLTIEVLDPWPLRSSLATANKVAPHEINLKRELEEWNRTHNRFGVVKTALSLIRSSLTAPTQKSVVLAGPSNPMRYPGAGVLPFIDDGQDGKYAIAHIRGTNRGDVWPPHVVLSDMFVWKEFAGVTGDPTEHSDPRITAKKELCEELAVMDHYNWLCPTANEIMASISQLATDLGRVNNSMGGYFTRANVPGWQPVRLVPNGYGITGMTAQNGVDVEIACHGKVTSFKSIVSIDPYNNTLELSFYTEITDKSWNDITGLASYPGDEHSAAIDRPPYWEDVVVFDPVK